MEINAILGKIQSLSLGPTLMHEHFSICEANMRFAFSDWFNEDIFLKKALSEVEKIKALGIKTIVDATPLNLGRNVIPLIKIAQATGINILVATGLYWHEDPWMRADRMDVDYSAGLFIKEVKEGIQGTGVKPAFIKCGTDKYGMTEVNRNLLAAAAIASKETDLPIYTHSLCSIRSGLAQQEFFAKQGVDISKIIIGHISDSQTVEYAEEILKNGSYIGFDRVGLPINPIEKIIATLTELLRRGWSKKIVLSHDAGVFNDFSRVCQPRCDEKNPSIGIWHIISRKLIPALQDNGVTDEQINDMMVNNPRRYFERKS